MKIAADSHTDHGLSPEHMAFAARHFADRTGFFIATVELPPELPSLSCDLYGPIMGDGPIFDDRCEMKQRPGRAWKSRLCALPPRPTRKLTVIAGPYKGDPCVLYTAFGGPATPREPADPSIDREETELLECEVFWQDHALSDHGQRTVSFSAIYEDHRGEELVAWWSMKLGKRTTMVRRDELHDMVDLAMFLGARVEWVCKPGDEPMGIDAARVL